MFIINDNLYKNLSYLKNYLDFTLNLNSLTDTQLENLLIIYERARYSLLAETKLYNKSLKESEKIKTIDDNYKIQLENEILKIYVPEVMPSYKNLKTHTYKRILANVKEISKPYKNLFKNQVCIFIKIYDKIQGWDIDNKFVKPISDALVMSEVIEDDNISKMFYCVKGEYSENPHTEIYIFDVKKETFFFDLISRKIILIWTFILKENLDTQKIYKFTYINTLKLLFGWLLCGGKEWTSKDVCSCTINLFRKNLFGGDKI